jgi:hypothetical protein
MDSKETVRFQVKIGFTINGTQGLPELVPAAIAVHPYMKLRYSWCLQVYASRLVQLSSKSRLVQPPCKPPKKKTLKNVSFWRLIPLYSGTKTQCTTIDVVHTDTPDIMNPNHSSFNSLACEEKKNATRA